MVHGVHFMVWLGGDGFIHAIVNWAIWLERLTQNLEDMSLDPLCEHESCTLITKKTYLAPLFQKNMFL